MDENWRSRPRKRQEDKLTRNIAFRVKDGTYKRIVDKAQQENRSVAEYVRATIEEDVGNE